MSNQVQTPAPAAPTSFVPITAAKVLSEKKAAPPPPAKTRKNAAVLVVPSGEFTIKTLVDNHKVSYAIAFQFVKKGREANTIKEVKTVSSGKRGKPTSVFSAV